MKIEILHRIHPHPLVRWVALAVIVALAAGVAHAGEPRYYAIKGAKIVPAVGPAIEGGTVVVANGLIAAVGRDIPVPAEALVIDGRGLSVYPGLMDALTDLGLQSARAAGPPAAGGGGPAVAIAAPAQQRPARGPEDRPYTTPWLMAADDLKTDDRRVETWRNAGFTTAFASPRSGIFAGQGAVINLRAPEQAGEMVVKTPAALTMTFATPGGFLGFPGALMGTISYIKQVMLDTQHYDAVRAAYNTSPRGKERPAYDHTAETMIEILRSGRPVLLPAQSVTQITRTLDLARQLKLNAVLYGVQQGYDAAAILAVAKAPVLVSLKWPEKDKDADPEAQDSLRALRFRDRAPSTPAALEKAGVKFAFYSDGIANPKDILKNAKKAIDAGLASDAALRALTIGGAEIFGVGDRLGSIEQGKIANLVVADGDLFNEKTKIKMVFVDGEKYEVREPARPQEPPQGTLAGKWSITVNTPQGAHNLTADLTMTPDGTVSGLVSTQNFGNSSVQDGWLSGKKFSFQITIQMGPQPATVSFSGELEGNTIKGTATLTGQSAEFTGTRPGGGNSAPEDGGA